MNQALESMLIDIARESHSADDPSHDFQHALRVLNLAKSIAHEVVADLDIVIPAALFHDVIVYPKNSPKSKNSAEDSADFAERTLNNCPATRKKKPFTSRHASSNVRSRRVLLQSFLKQKFYRMLIGWRQPEPYP